MYQFDLFCRVIDNWGDAGVSWRLANQLAAEFGVQVRLIIDEVKPLEVLASDVLDFGTDGRIRSKRRGIQVERWAMMEAGTAGASEVAPVVIEAFACDPPERYLAAMAERAYAGDPPVWLNLEYLSAEAWVDRVHGLPSPHPRLPLVKHFFVPGFTPASGGLIRERMVKPLPAESCALDAGDTDAARRLRVFSFTYPNAPVAELANALHAEVTLAAPLAVLPARVLPYWVVPQSEFDRILARHDLLLVRGEDSFLRAQYAGRPLLWHIYPTDDQAHLPKLEAWLDRYCVGLDPVTSAIYRRASRWFVAPDGQPPDWVAFARSLPILRRHAMAWQQHLCTEPDLATRMMAFISERKTMPGR
ncbi:MAG: elongation factor P maturation arginine rhamnosyltransferase EarP [Casimicrobiaceae bacterium]